jgi:hypothetical protein
MDEGHSLSYDMFVTEYHKGPQNGTDILEMIKSRRIIWAGYLA